MYATKMLSKHHKCNSFLLDTKVDDPWPRAAVIPVFITGHPVITKWGNCSTFNILTVVLKDIQQLWECQMYTVITSFCDNGTPSYENGNYSCCWPKIF